MLQYQKGLTWNFECCKNFQLHWMLFYWRFWDSTCCHSIGFSKEKPLQKQTTTVERIWNNLWSSSMEYHVYSWFWCIVQSHTAKTPWKFNSSPLNSYLHPIGKDRLPTTIFSGAMYDKLSGAHELSGPIIEFTWTMRWDLDCIDVLKNSLFASNGGSSKERCSITFGIDMSDMNRHGICDEPWDRVTHGRISFVNFWQVVWYQSWPEVNTRLNWKSSDGPHGRRMTCKRRKSLLMFHHSVTSNIFAASGFGDNEPKKDTST